MGYRATLDRAYRLVWSQLSSAWAEIAENAKERGKSGAVGKLAAAVLALMASLAYAAPGGGQITAGAGSIAQTGSTTTITQQGQRLAIDWQHFGIAANEAVRFNQPNAASIALNRVLGQSPSQIFGSLSANGQVFILNPNGVLFGSSAQVNVGGLLASTMGLSNADFMAGNYRFGNNGNHASVVNQGNLTAANGGYIALLAPEARNEGVVTATLGTVLLAAADKVTLNLNNGSLLSYTIDQGALNALAENKQLIQADGGQVIMTAKAANQLAIAAVNNTGIIEARTLQNRNGTITLLGDLQAGQVNVGGTLDASAPNGGDGGFIETSAAHVKVAADAGITTAAPQGKTGSWLIDPPDFTIAVGGGDITGATLAFNLGNTSVTILSSQGTVNLLGNGDIFVNDAVSWNSANSLTLSAVRNVTVNSAITNAGAGAINLTAAAAVAVNANLSTLGAIAVTAPTGLTQAVATTITTGTGLTVDAGAASTASGVIAGAGGLTKNGAGALTLSGINTYTGATTVNGGTLAISADRNLGAVPGVATPGSLTLNGGALQATLSFTLNAKRGIALTGAGGTFDIATGKTLTYSGIGVIAGTGTLTKTGAGTLTLAGINTYTGATAIDAGTLLIADDTGLGAAPATPTPGHLTFNGGTLEIQNILNPITLNANRGITLLAGGGTISPATGNTTTVAGVIAGSGALTKGLDGTLELSGVNTYTGLTTVSAGTLTLTGGAAIADTGAISLANVAGVTLDLNGSNETIASLTGGGATGGIVTNNSATATPSTLVTGDGTSTTFAGVIGDGIGTVALVKQGSGIFTLSGVNTYMGLTTVNAGTLAYGASNAISGAVTVNGGTLDIGSNSGTVGAVTLSSGAITGTTGVLTGSGYTVASGSISAILGGTGTLSKTTAGTVTLSGANSYTGATTISAGTLKLGAAGGATDTPLGTTGAGTSVAAGAVLDLNGFTLGTAEALTLNGTGISGGGALTNSSATAAAYSGAITLGSASSIAVGSGKALSTNGTINGAFALDVLGGGSITLGSSVGNSAPLASFSGAAGTVLSINGGMVRTTGAQTYNGATTFGGATTLSTTAGGNVSAPGTVTATAGTLTLATGAGDATLTNTGNDFSTVTISSGNNVSLVDTNALAIAGISATGLVDVRTQSGDLTLNTAAIATSSTSANAVTLVADVAATPNATGSGGNFKNAGNVAITTGAGGAWRVYTGNPAGTTRGGLAEAGKRYNTDDGSDPLASGNRIYFRIQPTLTLTADNKTKTYGDANPAFTYSPSGLIDGDSAGVAISSGPSYSVSGSTSTSGQLTALTLHDITSSAATASNLGYALSYASGTLTVNQKALAITVAGVSKVYDGGTAVTVSYGDNRIAGDVLSIAGTASYIDKNAGIDKTVNVNGITLTSTDAGNYTFNSTAATVADITAKVLSLSGLTAGNKAYDGTTTASISSYGSLTGILGGETVTLNSGGASSAFADKNVGAGKTVTVSSLALAGADNANYRIANQTTTADITARALTVTAANASKTYGQATTFAGTEFGSSGLQNGETIASISLASSGAASSASVGSSPYAIIPSAATGGSFSAANYTLSYVNGALTVHPAALSVTANAASKIYDGIAYRGGNGVVYSGFVNGESNAALGGTLAYGGTSQGAINAGSYAITPGGLTSGNYTITYRDGVLTVNLVTPTQAVVTLPGGSNLIPVYTAAVVAATAPVNPIAVPSGSSPSLTVVNGGVNPPPDSLGTDQGIN